MSALIRCSMCFKGAKPSRRDSVVCADCSLKLYARLAAATGEGIDGNALLDKMYRDNQVQSPSEAARGDSTNAHMGTVFEVKR